jgi:hypothetical protein
MNYELKITRKEKNPDYKSPENMRDIYNQRYDVPAFSTFDVLSVEITPEQFAAIRRAVLENF